MSATNDTMSVRSNDIIKWAMFKSYYIYTHCDIYTHTDTWFKHAHSHALICKHTDADTLMHTHTLIDVNHQDQDQMHIQWNLWIAHLLIAPNLWIAICHLGLDLRIPMIMQWGVFMYSQMYKYSENCEQHIALGAKKTTVLFAEVCYWLFARFCAYLSLKLWLWVHLYVQRVSAVCLSFFLRFCHIVRVARISLCILKKRKTARFIRATRDICFDFVHYASCNLWVQNKYIVRFFFLWPCTIRLILWLGRKVENIFRVK
jgi:hypothetical protein